MKAGRKMQEQPVFPLKDTLIEKALNIITLGVFIGTLMHLLTEWSILPDRIPGHDHVTGEGRWGNRGELLALSILGAAIWIGISKLEQSRYLYNDSKLTGKKVSKQYQNMRMAINFIKNEVVLIFSFLIWNDIQVAKGAASLVGYWFIMPAVLALFITLGVFVLRGIRIRE